MKQNRWVVMVAIVVLLSACIQAQGQATNEVLQVTPLTKPESGKATVVGQVVELKTEEPLADVIVRLAEVYREGQGGVFLLDHYSSPGARTDAQGYFVFPDLKPGEYVLVVGEGENINDYDIIEDGDTEKAKVWSAPADQITDWGVIQAIVMFR